ncbi:putative sugar phosphate isomerase YwlF [Synechococcus phage Ssp-JY38]|nr:ribose-5-phosphate isomerase [Synechococcus phage Yong-L2-223]
MARIILGADSLGMPLLTALVQHFNAQGREVRVRTPPGSDYPEIGHSVCRSIVAGEYDRGILVCGTGAGMAIAANKVPGIRAVCVSDPHTAVRAAASNDAQVITFGSQVIGHEVAILLAELWLNSTFQGGRSEAKVAALRGMDELYRK